MPNGLTDIGLLYAHSGVPGGGKLFGNIEEDPAKAMEYYLAGFEAGVIADGLALGNPADLLQGRIRSES